MTRLERARFHLATAQRHLTIYRLRAISSVRDVKSAQNDLLALDLRLKLIQERTK